ncbi:hypothetical protein [Butyricicoccus pullicaecorum]|uniref:hypothetical protein n=1 Tax=Butyricicoccus pullicaecorum TaxID=501571 RepID=UPI0013A654DA|nr:hypothetical protein [Butyricicoccus pullicaecorum]
MERFLFLGNGASADALEFLFLVDFRKAKIKKGISLSAESDSGRCPENLQTFEKV